MLDISEILVIIIKSVAGVAHPVERHLAKVEVASSSLVTRSIKRKDHTKVWSFLFMARGGDDGSKNKMRLSGGQSLAAGLDGGNTIRSIPTGNGSVTSLVTRPIKYSPVDMCNLL